SLPRSCNRVVSSPRLANTGKASSPSWGASPLRRTKLADCVLGRLFEMKHSRSPNHVLSERVAYRPHPRNGCGRHMNPAFQLQTPGPTGPDAAVFPDLHPGVKLFVASPGGSPVMLKAVFGTPR